MMSFIRPRLRKPAWSVLFGAVFAAAWAIRGGHNWWLFVILIAIGTAARAFSFYMWGGEDDDVGALMGSRADERQRQVSLRSRATGFNVAAVAAFAGLTAAVALNAGWWWPFGAILLIQGLTYLLGLSTFGIAEEGPAEDGENERRPSAPVGQ